MGMQCNHRQMVACPVCRTCTYDQHLYLECPECARVLGRGNAYRGCRHKDDPYCFTRKTDHCSCCLRRVFDGETMYQYILKPEWGPTWCEECGPTGSPEDFKTFTVHPESKKKEPVYDY